MNTYFQEISIGGLFFILFCSPVSFFRCHLVLMTDVVTPVANYIGSVQNKYNGADEIFYSNTTTIRA